MPLSSLPFRGRRNVFFSQKPKKTKSSFSFWLILLFSFRFVVEFLWFEIICNKSIKSIVANAINEKKKPQTFRISFTNDDHKIQMQKTKQKFCDKIVLKVASARPRNRTFALCLLLTSTVCDQNRAAHRLHFDESFIKYNNNVHRIRRNKTKQSEMRK